MRENLEDEEAEDEGDEAVASLLDRVTGVLAGSVKGECLHWLEPLVLSGRGRGEDDGLLLLVGGIQCPLGLRFMPKGERAAILAECSESVLNIVFFTSTLSFGGCYTNKLP